MNISFLLYFRFFIDHPILIDFALKRRWDLDILKKVIVSKVEAIRQTSLSIMPRENV